MIAAYAVMTRYLLNSNVLNIESLIHQSNSTETTDNYLN